LPPYSLLVNASLRLIILYFIFADINLLKRESLAEWYLTTFNVKLA